LSKKTLYEEAESAFAPLLALQREADQLHEELKTCDPAGDEFREMLERQGEIQHRLDGSDIYTVRARIEKVPCSVVAFFPSMTWRPRPHPFPAAG